MARKVFFSFHYQRDLWRVNVVRNSGAIEGISAAGFHDASLWEETKRKGDVAVKKLIDSGLDGTTVTVVLIGAKPQIANMCHTRSSKASRVGMEYWAFRINNIKDKDGRTDPAWSGSSALIEIGAPVYTWEYGKLGEWVEKAYKRVNRKS